MLPDLHRAHFPQAFLVQFSQVPHELLPRELDFLLADGAGGPRIAPICWQKASGKTLAKAVRFCPIARSKKRPFGGDDDKMSSAFDPRNFLSLVAVVFGNEGGFS